MIYTHVAHLCLFWVLQVHLQSHLYLHTRVVLFAAFTQNATLYFFLHSNNNEHNGSNVLSKNTMFCEGVGDHFISN